MAVQTITRKERVDAVKDTLVEALALEVESVLHLPIEEAHLKLREASRAEAAKLFDSLDRTSPTYLVEAEIIVEAIVALAQEMPALVARAAQRFAAKS